MSDGPARVAERDVRQQREPISPGVGSIMSLPLDLARSVYKRVRRRRAAPAPLKRVFFLHLPKCGGTSVDEALKTIYSRAGHGVTHLDPVASKRAATIAGDDPRRARTRLLLYEMSRSDRRYISGHFSYSEEAWNAFGDDWHFLTLLREPVSRWYSHYFFDRYKADDHARISEPIEVFVESERARRFGRNYVERLIPSGVEAEADDTVDRAIANLQRFSLVGVLEELDTFTRDCKRLLGVSVAVEHRNRSPRTTQQRTEEVSPAIAARVVALCEPNRRVYEAVRARIRQRVSWMT